MDSAKTTYTIIPAPTLEKLEPILKENSVEYELLYENDILDTPEEKLLPFECVFFGRTMHKYLVCLKSELDPVKLLKFDEDLHNPGPKPVFSEVFGLK